MPRKISASTGPASHIKVVRITGWPRQPRVIARNDAKDEITVEVTMRYEGERAKLVRLRGGIAQLITTSSQERPRRLRVADSELTAVVCVPMGQLGTIQVDTSTPGRRSARK